LNKLGIVLSTKTENGLVELNPNGTSNKVRMIKVEKKAWNEVVKGKHEVKVEPVGKKMSESGSMVSLKAPQVWKRGVNPGPSSVIAPQCERSECSEEKKGLQERESVSQVGTTLNESAGRCTEVLVKPKRVFRARNGRTEWIPFGKVDSLGKPWLKTQNTWQSLHCRLHRMEGRRLEDPRGRVKNQAFKSEPNDVSSC